MIRIDSLTHSYGSNSPALTNLSAEIADGSITGVIGPNGSGKTTLLKALAGYLDATSGAIESDGRRLYREDLVAYAIYVGDDGDFRNTAAASVLRYARLRPTWSEETFTRIAKRFNLKARGGLGRRSQGERSLFMTAVALASGARLTLLDEPTGNLDVPTRLALTEEIIHTAATADEAADPRSFIISSHLVSELENLIDHVIVLDEGEVIASTTAEELRSSTVALIGRRDLILPAVEADPVARILAERPLGRLAEIRVSNASTTTLDALAAAGVEIQPLSFQDAFVSLIEEN